MTNKALERNILYYYIIRALFLPFFWLPIIYFYLTSVKGLSPAHTTILLGLQEFLLIFLEVPTGVVADKVSRKVSIAIGYAITSLPFVFLPYVENFWILVSLFAVKALGKAFVSGADSAIMYDTLVDLDRTSDFKKIKTSSGAWTLAITALVIFLGGLMGQHGLYALTFWLPLPLHLIGALAAILMVEPQTSRTAKNLQESNYLSHSLSALKIVVSHKTLLYTALAFAVIESTALNMKWYYPAIFEYLTFSVGLVGTIMSSLYIGKAVINAVGRRFIMDNPLANTRLWTLLIAISFAVMFVLPHRFIIVPLIVVILMGLEIAVSSSEELIHTHLDSKNRATAMSFVNLLSSLSATVLIGSWGILVGSYNVLLALLFQAFVFLLVYMVATSLRSPNSKPNYT